MGVRSGMLGVCLVLVIVTTASAAPWRPTNDREVLDTLPSSLSDLRARELRAQHRALLANPRDLPAATTLARAYLLTSRTTGDPRYTGYAQSALAPWWSQPAPPPEVALLRAQIRQRTHAFDAALADLDRVVRMEPGRLDARTQRATIHTVRGDYAAADVDCTALAAAGATLPAALCAAGIMSMTGGLNAAYDTLLDAVTLSPGMDGAVAAWALTTLGEFASRQGDILSAEGHFRAALALAPDDQYLLMVFADHLLALGKADETVRLTRAHRRNDGLLLRHVLALQAAGHAADARRWATALRTRFAAAAARGDDAHRREEARFMLEIEQRPDAALVLARRNWQDQREPADLEILLRAARATGDTAALAEARAWMAQTGLEDVALRSLLR
ncbi:MAG: tetratricopeptide repeat protein [Gammaproteobacteria bacterium]